METENIIAEIKEAVASMGGRELEFPEKANLDQILNELPQITVENLQEYVNDAHTFTVLGNKSIFQIYYLLAHLIREFVDNEVISYRAIFKCNNEDWYSLYPAKYKELRDFTAQNIPEGYKAILLRYAIGIFLLFLERLEK